MNEEIAQQSVDFMFAESDDSPTVNLTFFGGETLMNFKVLKSALAYARERAAALGKEVNSSLTTNATLLREEVIDWIVENDVGVTVSIDGAREQQDKHRTFSNGMGSYDIIIPNIKQLLARHRRRPVGARVTLTGQNLDVVSIYKHLFEEIGFWEVGFAPVTTSWQREYSIQDDGFQTLLSGFQTLAADFLQSALAGRRHGFSNVRDTLEELHKGMSKAYPCGAGTWPHGRGDRRRRRALPSLRRLRLAQAGHRVRRRRSRAPGRLSHQAPHREQDRLRDVLGAAAVRRRLLPRSAHALRLDGRAEPALLRLDSELDEHLPRGLRHARRACSGVPDSVRPVTSCDI